MLNVEDTLVCLRRTKGFEVSHHEMYFVYCLVGSTNLYGIGVWLELWHTYLPRYFSHITSHAFIAFKAMSCNVALAWDV